MSRPARLRRWCVLVALLCAATSRTQPVPELPDGPGREVVARACNQCHALEIVLRAHLSRNQWEARIDEMIARGAKLTDEDIDVIADYLAAHFGPPSN